MERIYQRCARQQKHRKIINTKSFQRVVNSGDFDDWNTESSDDETQRVAEDKQLRIAKKQKKSKKQSKKNVAKSETFRKMLSAPYNEALCTKLNSNSAMWQKSDSSLVIVHSIDDNKYLSPKCSNSFPDNSALSNSGESNIDSSNAPSCSITLYNNRYALFKKSPEKCFDRKRKNLFSNVGCQVNLENYIHRNRDSKATQVSFDMMEVSPKMSGPIMRCDTTQTNNLSVNQEFVFPQVLAKKNPSFIHITANPDRKSTVSPNMTVVKRNLGQCMYAVHKNWPMCVQPRNGDSEIEPDVLNNLTRRKSSHYLSKPEQTIQPLNNDPPEEVLTNDHKSLLVCQFHKLLSSTKQKSDFQTEISNHLDNSSADDFDMVEVFPCENQNEDESYQEEHYCGDQIGKRFKKKGNKDSGGHVRRNDSLIKTKEALLTSKRERRPRHKVLVQYPLPRRNKTAISKQLATVEDTTPEHGIQAKKQCMSQKDNTTNTNSTKTGHSVQQKMKEPVAKDYNSSTFKLRTCSAFQLRGARGVITRSASNDKKSSMLNSLTHLEHEIGTDLPSGSKSPMCKEQNVTYSEASDAMFSYFPLWKSIQKVFTNALSTVSQTPPEGNTNLSSKESYVDAPEYVEVLEKCVYNTDVNETSMRRSLSEVPSNDVQRRRNLAGESLDRTSRRERTHKRELTISPKIREVVVKSLRLPDKVVLPVKKVESPISSKAQTKSETDKKGSKSEISFCRNEDKTCRRQKIYKDTKSLHKEISNYNTVSSRSTTSKSECDVKEQAKLNPISRHSKKHSEVSARPSKVHQALTGSKDPKKKATAKSAPIKLKKANSIVVPQEPEAECLDPSPETNQTSLTDENDEVSPNDAMKGTELNQVQS